MKHMNNWTKAAIIAAFLSIGVQAALAEPMKCSGEQKKCTTPCARLPAAQIQACVENCRVSQANCLRSGCWASGASRYCGLMKQ
jgi:hypothetical protein